VVKYLKSVGYSISSLKYVSRPYIQPILSQILKNEKSSQPMHNILKSNNCTAVCKLKWEQKLNIKFEDKEWKTFF
jgi:hypothetical protein